MATGRTEFELKTFLEGSKDQYDAFIKANGAEGVLFFDTNNHAVYAKDKCVIKSNVASVELVVPSGSTGTDKTAIKLTYFDGSSDEIDTAIPNAFVRFDATQNLTDPQKEKARANIGAEAADATILKQGNVVNNLTTDSATVPLSAAQGKELKRQIDEKVTAETGKGLSTNDYTDGDKDKLAGIEEGAQKNRLITVNDNRLGDDEQTSEIKISGNLISLTNNGEDGQMAVNLYAEYSSTDKKIYFRNGDTEDASNLFTIDTTDFVRDGMVSGVTYDATNKNLVITFNTDSGKEAITVSLASLVDTYTAGNGLTVTNNEFSAKLGDGLEFNTYKNITVKYNPIGGITVNPAGVALKAATNGGITVGANGAAVDWTKAPVLSVNGQTGAVTIDVTPKVWSF